MDGFLTGRAALHPDWPEARFNLSGMFVADMIVAGYMNFVERAFGVRGPVESVHGAPDCRWNAGRMIPGATDRAKIEKTISIFNDNRVGCILTFSNHLLEAADLGDPLCNFLLDRIAARPDLNGVIISSDRLSSHIAERYPGLPQVASIVKVSVEDGRGKPSYYHELGKRFSRYVVHPDDCHDLRLLEQLDRDKAELLVNENCLLNCPLRARHYGIVARTQIEACRARDAARGAAVDIAALPGMRELRRFAAETCPGNPVTKQIFVHRPNCNFTPEHMKRVYDLGFRHFKIQGRGDHLYPYIYDLVRYTLEPGRAAPLILKAIVLAIQVEMNASTRAAARPWPAPAGV